LDHTDLTSEVDGAFLSWIQIVDNCWSIARAMMVAG